MAGSGPSVSKQIRLSSERAAWLEQLAKRRGMTEDAIIERALTALATMEGVWHAPNESLNVSNLSDEALRRVWDNDQDVAYDDWRTLFDLAAR
jgi:hypothetical protein